MEVGGKKYTCGWLSGGLSDTLVGEGEGGTSAKYGEVAKAGGCVEKVMSRGCLG